MSSASIYVESRKFGALVFLHLGSAFLSELDRGPGLNETGHSFPSNKNPVHMRSGDFVKVQDKIKSKTNAMRGDGLKLPHRAQVRNKADAHMENQGTLQADSAG